MPPVGVPVLGPRPALTAAVNVTGWPKTLERVETLKVVLVAAAVTVSVPATNVIT